MVDFQLWSSERVEYDYKTNGGGFFTQFSGFCYLSCSGEKSGVPTQTKLYSFEGGFLGGQNQKLFFQM